MSDRLNDELKDLLEWLFAKIILNYFDFLKQEEMGLEKIKEKLHEEKEERRRRKITEMMLGESRVMCRSGLDV